jgi:hypothetical protein
MKMFRKAFTLVAALAAAPSLAAAPAQASAPTAAQARSQEPKTVDLPVTKVVLFSSGVGYFEHRGDLSGDCLIPLHFAVEEVNDALKSLLVSDGASSPSVSYPSMASLDRSLKGLRIDLSGAPRVADLLARLRGAEISVDTPETLSGRIVSVEQRSVKEGDAPRPYVTLLTSSGLRSVSLNDAQAVRFSDKGIGEDFDRALSLILGARDDRARDLEVRLPGPGTRQATIGYVIAAPVWKASYRLDLSRDEPQIQGWAIVDNPSDQDWKNVSLSLVSGRPVSFIQELYPPVYLDRPTIPLAIAGTAAARSFESGIAPANAPEESDYDEAEAKEAAPKRAMKSMAAPAPSSVAGGAFAPAPAAPLGQAALETARAGKAGDQFQFTVKKPVNLDRGRSAMLPLVAGKIEAERVSVLSPGARRPMLGARLVNTTGVRLPAGPVAVFDGGVYAGDALFDFFSEKDTRLVVFGDDLDVSVDVSDASSQETVGVVVAKGVMAFSRRVTVEKSYAFANKTADAKKIVVEHSITGGAELYEPKAAAEKTDSLYRFDLALPASGQAKLVVKERYPRSERVVLGSLRPEDFLAYSSSQEIPAKVREALKKAVEMKKKLTDAERDLADLQERKAKLESDQSRYRSNLSEVGRDSSQGQQYLKRLMDSEAAIDQTSTKIEQAKNTRKEAQTTYESYLAGLSL